MGGTWETFRNTQYFKTKDGTLGTHRLSKAAAISTALWQIGELQARRGRATIGGQLVPFSRVLDIGSDHDRVEPFDDVRIIGSRAAAPRRRCRR